MRTVSTKLAREQYEQLKDYAENQGTTVSELLRNFVQELSGEKVEQRFRKDSSSGVRGKIPYCPQCGFILSFNFRSSEWGCVKCGYYFYVQAPVWQRGEEIKI